MVAIHSGTCRIQIVEQRGVDTEAARYHHGYHHSARDSFFQFAIVGRSSIGCLLRRVVVVLRSVAVCWRIFGGARLRFRLTRKCHQAKHPATIPTRREISFHGMLDPRNNPLHYTITHHTGQESLPFRSVSFIGHRILHHTGQLSKNLLPFSLVLS